jgi:hypothetical protein
MLWVMVHVQGGWWCYRVDGEGEGLEWMLMYRVNGDGTGCRVDGDGTQ